MSSFAHFVRPVVALAVGLGVASFNAQATGLVTTLPTAMVDAQSVFSFSTLAQTTMTRMGIDVNGLGNSHLTAGATNWAFDMPVTQVTVSASLLPVGLTPVSGKATGSALGIYGESGGLVLANFSLDFQRNMLSADLTTSQGTTKSFDVFSFHVADGLKLSTNGGLSLNMSLDHMMLTDPAKDRFANALGLESYAVAALGKIDFGTLAINISPSLRTGLSDKAFTTTAVPEAPPLFAMALGLIGIAAVSRRQRVAHGGQG